MIKHEATNIARFLGEGTKGSKFQPKRGSSASSLLRLVEIWNPSPKIPLNSICTANFCGFLLVLIIKYNYIIYAIDHCRGGSCGCVGTEMDPQVLS